MSNVRNLKQAIVPIIWLNCIFCMGIFEIPINRPRYFFSIFYVISIIIGYFTIFYKGIDIFQQAFAYEFMIFHFVLGINILVAILAIILFWWKSEVRKFHVKAARYEQIALTNYRNIQLI